MSVFGALPKCIKSTSICYILCQCRRAINHCCDHDDDDGGGGGGGGDHSNQSTHVQSSIGDLMPQEESTQ